VDGPSDQSLRKSKGAKVDQWLAQRVFVSCTGEDDLDYIINTVRDDFLVTATDFPHDDVFRQDHIAQAFSQRNDLKDHAVEKILSRNPLRLYHL
jgi:hypothetical protein